MGVLKSLRPTELSNLHFVSNGDGVTLREHSLLATVMAGGIDGGVVEVASVFNCHFVSFLGYIGTIAWTKDNFLKFHAELMFLLDADTGNAVKWFGGR